MNAKGIIIIGLVLLFAFAQGGGGVVVPSGKQTIMVVHESGSDTPWIGNLAVSLNSGDAAKYIADGGHKYLFLDKDTVGYDDKPLPILERFKPYAVPELIIANETGESLILRKPCPQTAAEIIALSKGS
jgi:hypothetical protein